MILTDKLSNIANAIRSKTGKSEEMTLDEMPVEIEGIFGNKVEKPFDCHSVTFVYGDKSYVRSVADGDTCADPVERGLIPTPTKQSTAQYDYTYYGWGASDGGAANANILKNITEDKTVYAIFTATVRYYTITWLDEDGTELPGQKQWAYGSVPSNSTGRIKDGYTEGWSPEITPVAGNAVYTFIWVKNAWTWDLSNGVLIISGAGPMDNYESKSANPWYSRRAEITSIVVEHGISTIGDRAFYECTNATSVTIPDSVTRIGRSAFYICSGLLSVTIPDSVTSIDPYAFFKCTAITSMTIPDGVNTIDAGVFERCENLSSVTIPDSVTSIGDYAFSGCTGLTSIIIPDGVTSIGDYAFQNCTNLSSVTIPYGVTEIGIRAFALCSSLTSVTIPDSVTKICSNAFRECANITSVTIGFNVSLIENYAFYGCNLSSAVFQDTTTWQVSEDASFTKITNVTVTNSTTAATQLKTTYVGYYWRKI